MSNPTVFKVPDGYYAPFSIVSDTDHGGWIIIATALGFVLALISTLIRIYVKWMSRQAWGTDDLLLAIGTIIAFIQESVILGACANGLGRKVALLELSDLRQVEKSFYTSQIFTLLSLGLCKTSCACFIMRLTPKTSVKRVIIIYITCVAAWMLSGILAFALQCDLRRPWGLAAGACRGIYARIVVIAIVDMGLELALLGTSILLVAGLKTYQYNKAKVILAFALRLPLIGFIAARLATGNVNTSDFALSETMYIIWTVTEINYSLISATLPISHPFIKDLSTFYGGALPPSEYGGGSSNSRGTSFPMSTFNKSRSKGSVPNARIPSYQKDGNKLDFGALRHSAYETTTHCEADPQSGPSTDAVSFQSAESQESQRMFIRVETEWAVERPI